MTTTTSTIASVPGRALCWETVSGPARIETRFFVAGRFAGYQEMHNQRARWSVTETASPQEAIALANSWMRRGEELGNHVLTVQPGEVRIDPSEYSNLSTGGLMPPSLRVRIRQRVRRYHRTITGPRGPAA